MVIGGLVVANQAVVPAEVFKNVVAVAIYGILCPFIYLIVLFVGTELAWPGRTILRGFAKLPNVLRQTRGQHLSDNPTFRTLCSVGGLIALAVWSVVITNWLAGKVIALPTPTLANPPYHDLQHHYYPDGHAAYPWELIAALVIGFVLGSTWVTAMRLVRRAQMALIVVAVSMSLAGILLFYYIVQEHARDLLLVVALGIFVGELIAVARNPWLLGEGLFAELFLVPEVPEDDAADANGEDPVPDDDPWRPQSRVWQGPAANASARAEPGGTARAGPSATVAADASPAAPAAGTVTVPIRQPWTLMRPSAPPTRDTEDDGGSVTPPGGE